MKYVLGVLCVIVAAGALVCGVAFGASGQNAGLTTGLSADRIDKQVATPFRASVAVVDTLTETVILATTAFDTTGFSPAANATSARSTITVSAIFTQSGQTATVEVWRVYYKADGTKGLKGKTVLSFSGGSTLEAGAYWSEEQYAACSGSAEIRVVVTAFSGSGTLDLRVGSF